MSERDPPSGKQRNVARNECGEVRRSLSIDENYQGIQIAGSLRGTSIPHSYQPIGLLSQLIPAAGKPDTEGRGLPDTFLFVRPCVQAIRCASFGAFARVLRP